MLYRLKEENNHKLDQGEELQFYRLNHIWNIIIEDQPLNLHKFIHQKDPQHKTYLRIG